MRIIFFGTPYYVLPILDALNKAFKERSGESPIAGVVTQPPKPVGRKKILQYSAVDKWAHKRSIKILRDLDIKNFPKADIGILASYGNIIPKEVINHFPQGILVIHPSLLPEFRWSSPVPAAIVTNKNPTGVTIFKMDEKWDHGPIVTSVKEDVSQTDTYQTLRDRLFERSASILVHALPAYIKGIIKLKPQDDSKASYARMIKKEDAFIPPKFLNSCLQGEALEIPWEIGFIKMSDEKSFTLYPSPFTIDSFIRAMDPWPGAWTLLRTSASEGQAKRLKILKAHVENDKLILDEVQLEGKNKVFWEEFKRGYPNLSL